MSTHLNQPLFNRDHFYLRYTGENNDCQTCININNQYNRVDRDRYHHIDDLHRQPGSRQGDTTTVGYKRARRNWRRLIRGVQIQRHLTRNRGAEINRSWDNVPSVLDRSRRRIDIGRRVQNLRRRYRRILRQDRRTIRNRYAAFQRLRRRFPNEDALYANGSKSILLWSRRYKARFDRDDWQ